MAKDHREIAKVERALARTTEEEHAIEVRRSAMKNEAKMQAKAEKAAEKLDAKRSHQHYGHDKFPADRYTGHQPKGALAKKPGSGM